MSISESERSSVMLAMSKGFFWQGTAAERLGLRVQQVKRRLRVWGESEDAGLVSRQHESISPCRFPVSKHVEIEDLLRVN